MKKLAIFDLDGTLLDSIGDIAKACNQSLRDCGLPEHPVEAYKKMVGNGIRKLLERAVPPEVIGTEIHKQVTDKYNFEYNLVCMKDSVMFEGTTEFLEKLKANGFVLAIVTNKPDEMSQNIVKNTLPQGLISQTIGARQGIPTKPDPTGVRLVMEEFGASPDETIYIGDSNVDIFTAQNAGVKSIGVSWGFRGRQELEEAGADAIVDTYEELYEELLKN